MCDRWTCLLTAKNDVETLEDVFEDGNVAGEEDEGDDRGVRYGRDARVLPLDHC